MKSFSVTKTDDFFKKYKHLSWQAYWLLYLPWFAYLEHTVTTDFHVIHMPIDDLIPFCEYFVIPYFLWFAYIAWAILYFAFKNKDAYYRLCKVLFFGMTVFLITSTLIPNGHYLRPTTFAGDNLFVDMVKGLYAADTSTNLFPSIHVYNSLAVAAAVLHAKEFKHRPLIRLGSTLLAVSIVLSTMFLKQHSVFDVITGILLAVCTIHFVYRYQPSATPAKPLSQRLRRI